MATKTISITESAYNRLANLKREHESFSIVIERMTKKKSLSDFYGILSKETGKELERKITRNRKTDEKIRRVHKKNINEMMG